MDDYISGLFGLGGALIGALAGYFGTRQAQRHAAETARVVRVQDREERAVASLISLFSELQQHVRGVPGRANALMAKGEHLLLNMERREWDKGLYERISPARVAVGALRDAATRDRLVETLDLLEAWKSGIHYAFHDRTPRWVLGEVVSHAVDCIGAWQREEDLPAPNDGFTRAREALALWEEEMEADILRQQEQASERTDGDKPPSAGSD